MTEPIRHQAIAYDGNAALKMEAAEAAPPQHTQAPPRRKKSAPKPAAGPKPQRKQPVEHKTTDRPSGTRVQPSWKSAPKAVMWILIVAAMVVFTLASYANLVIINDQRVDLRSELDTLKTEETKLMAQYELAYDLQEIENQMISSGQMTKIQNWQTYTLELSEPDAVEYYQGSDLKENVVSFARNLTAAVQEYF